MQRETFMRLIDDRKSARSMQKAVGPSEIGGCRRKVWHRLQGSPRVNPNTLSMAAWMGTSIHTELERRMKKVDPFRYLLEVEVSRDGLKGHVDVYDKEECEVIDWKTTTKKNLGGFPTDQQIAQVQVYGWLLEGEGWPVDTVTLVGIPRDGNELQVVFHSEPYDEATALEALEWLREVEQAVLPPEPEKHVRFCKDYCEYWEPDGVGGCPGMGGQS